MTVRFVCGFAWFLQCILRGMFIFSVLTFRFYEGDGGSDMFHIIYIYNSG